MIIWSLGRAKISVVNSEQNGVTIVVASFCSALSSQMVAFSINLFL